MVLFALSTVMYTINYILSEPEFECGGGGGGGGGGVGRVCSEAEACDFVGVVACRRFQNLVCQYQLWCEPDRIELRDRLGRAMLWTGICFISVFVGVSDWFGRKAVIVAAYFIIVVTLGLLIVTNLMLEKTDGHLWLTIIMFSVIWGVANSVVYLWNLLVIESTGWDESLR
jgi:hypothetical protein